MDPDSGTTRVRSGPDAEDTTEVLVLDGTTTQPVPAEPKRDRCTLTMLAGPTVGKMFPIEEDQVIIGRGSEAAACVPDRSLSRRHARVYRRGEGFYVEDLGSTNGTFLNGAAVKLPTKVHEGDRIQVGSGILFRVHLQDEVEQAATRRLYESAVRDPLTHVHNRRYLDERLVTEFAYSRRHLTPLSLLLVDLDHFKRINDTVGHLAGDAVLRVVAGAMQRMLRTEDLVARYGGEEFCVVARGIDGRNAMIVGERIRRTVEGLAIPWEGSTLRVTLSVGITTMDQEHPFPSVETLLAAADAALYRAKSGGRNRCRT
ncbi:MAG: diguanylate cyclase [Myxococcota bacterium]